MIQTKTILGIFALIFTTNQFIGVNMKKIAFIFLFIGITGFSVILGQNGANIYNNPDYGADSTARMNCANHLSTMSEFMKINLYSYALSSWKIVFDECPASSKNIYLYGIKIYRDYLSKEKDLDVYSVLVNTGGFTTRELSEIKTKKGHANEELDNTLEDLTNLTSKVSLYETK